jgi:hypothetical protein
MPLATREGETYSVGKPKVAITAMLPVIVKVAGFAELDKSPLQEAKH